MVEKEISLRRGINEERKKIFIPVKGSQSRSFRTTTNSDRGRTGSRHQSMVEVISDLRVTRSVDREGRLNRQI